MRVSFTLVGMVFLTGCGKEDLPKISVPSVKPKSLATHQTVYKPNAAEILWEKVIMSEGIAEWSTMDWPESKEALLRSLRGRHLKLRQSVGNDWVDSVLGDFEKWIDAQREFHEALIGDGLEIPAWREAITQRGNEMVEVSSRLRPGLVKEHSLRIIGRMVPHYLERMERLFGVIGSDNEDDWVEAIRDFIKESIEFMEATASHDAFREYWFAGLIFKQFTGSFREINHITTRELESLERSLHHAHFCSVSVQQELVVMRKSIAESPSSAEESFDWFSLKIDLESACSARAKEHSKAHALGLKNFLKQIL
jgi:hypothetical protein